MEAPHWQRFARPPCARRVSLLTFGLLFLQHMKEYYDMYSADLEAFVTPLLESLGPAASELAHSAAGTEEP